MFALRFARSRLRFAFPGCQRAKRGFPHEERRERARNFFRGQIFRKIIATSCKPLSCMKLRQGKSFPPVVMLSRLPSPRGCLPVVMLSRGSVRSARGIGGLTQVYTLQEFTFSWLAQLETVVPWSCSPLDCLPGRRATGSRTIRRACSPVVVVCRSAGPPSRGVLYTGHPCRGCLFSVRPYMGWRPGHPMLWRWEKVGE